MKNLHFHKNPILVGVGILAVLFIIFIFTTCDIGLGQIVNTEKPIISNGDDGNGPGSFLQGENNKIELNVENKLGFKIKTVEMEVEYIDKNTGEHIKKKFPGHINEVTGKWEVDLDVSDMRDGKISAWVTAIDESGNETTSTEITYFVKNMLPQVKLTIPSVTYDNFDNTEFLQSIVLNNVIYQGVDIMGLATDNFGIMVEKDENGNITDEWPKIMFWPSDLEDIYLDDDKIPLPSNKQYGVWRTVVMPANHDSTATQFSWPFLQLVEDLDGSWRLPVFGTSDNYKTLKTNQTYRFRIWIKDAWGNDNFYPNRIDNKRGPNGTPADPDTAVVKYIEVMHQSVGDKPVIKVPNPKRFYNRVGDFVVDFVVEAGETFDYGDDAAVIGWITTKNDGTGLALGSLTKNAVQQNPSTSNAYVYKFTITEAEAKSWGEYQADPKTLFVALVGKNSKNEQGPIDYQNFQLDETPPSVIIDQPSLLTNTFKTGTVTGGNYTILYPPAYVDINSRPKWVTSTVTTGGRCDDKTQIDKIYYHIGKVYTTAAQNDDKLVNDADLKAFYENDAMWADTGLGTSNTATDWGGSVYSWTYTKTYFRDTDYKNDSTYKNLIQELSELGGNLGTTTAANYITTGKQRFYLPLYVKVVDVAGNRQIVHYKLSIDPLMDEPQTSIIYPGINEDGSAKTVGGTVRITGSAEDNYWMHKVVMRIKKAGTAAGVYYIPTTYPVTSPFYSLYPTYPVPTGYTNAGWFETTAVGDGPMVNWTATVNGDAGLNPTSGDTVNVTVEVFAIDTNVPAHDTPWLAGPVETQNVIFSSKVPTIEDIKVTTNGTEKDYKEGISAAGKFTISMKISANIAINKLVAKVNTNPAVTLISSNANTSSVDGVVWALSAPAMNGTRQEKTLTITVDSTAVDSIAKVNYGNTGIMNLEITVDDNSESHFSTTNNFRISIDNFYPVSTIETPTMAYDDKTIPKYFLVQGEAQDWSTTSGSTQGLERVVVYFEKAQINYTNTTNWTGRSVTGTQAMLKPDGSTAATSDFIGYPAMDTAKSGWSSSTVAPNALTGFSMPKLVNSGTVSVPKWTSPAAMVIDYAENDNEQDYDNDGTYGERWIGLTEITWGARMMITDRLTTTQRFPDGPYIVHYVVMDKAGNATHYQKDIFIENNKPRITSINIGTDINFNGTVAPSEYRDQDFAVNTTSEATNRNVFPDEEFRIRNTRLGVKLTLDKGNGQKKATISYVTRNNTAIPVTNMQRGYVYQIASTAQNTDFTKFGAPNNYQNTVFVASSTGQGSATVYQFTTVATMAAVNVVTGSTYVDFLNFSGVTDRTDGLFIAKVYDTTLTASQNNNLPVNAEYDQLAQAFLLTVSVANTDNILPKIEVANFGRRHKPVSLVANIANYDNNVLTALADAVYSDYVDTTTTGVKNGYVQYQEHSSPNTHAYISGKVIFNGKVNDNHRIAKITVQIQNSSNANIYNGGEFNIAIRDNSDGLLKPDNNNNNYVVGEREFRLVYNESDVPQYTLAYGQTLVWQFLWDSSKIKTAATNAENNVKITFRVYDINSTNATATFSIQNVHIVPYISEVYTSLSDAYSSTPSVFNRSALGGYPVREGETNFKISGFNLGNAVSNATIGTVALSTGSNNGTVINTSIPTAATSGDLTVTVASIASFNNNAAKNKTVAYNKEPNNVNNNILDNSRYIYVWNTGDLFHNGTYYTTTDGFNNTPSGTSVNIAMKDVSYPFMRLDKDGNRLISHGFYNTQSSGRLRVLKNNTIIELGIAATNRMVYTSIGTGGRNASFYATGTDLSSGATYNRGFQLGFSNNDGTNSVSGHTGTSTVNGTNYGAHGDIRIYATDSSAHDDRFAYPRIAVQSAADDRANGNDKVLLSYYDSDAGRNEVVFVSVGSNSTSSITTTAGNNNQNTINNTFKKEVSTAGSEFSAAGILSNGIPVVAYYSNTNKNLNIAYAATVSGTNSTTIDSWTTTPNIDTDKGSYVDMAVDGGDNIHLAYYSNKGGLYYTYIPCTGTGAARRPDVGNRKTVRVDTYLSAGTRLMINVRQETTPTTRYVPYITYAHASFPGTVLSVRVAWLASSVYPTITNTSNGTDENNMFLGNWEVMTVPVSGTPNNSDFVCNGLPSKATWNTAGTTLSYNTNLNQTIVIGYMTTTSVYEGAILKGDIREIPQTLRK